MPRGKILLLEDDEAETLHLFAQLEATGYPREQVLHCSQLPQIQLPEPGDIKLVLASLGLKGIDGNRTFRHILKKFPYTPIVILTDNAHIDLAIDTLHRGAEDYLLKGTFDQKMLEKTMLYAIERKKSSNDFRRLFINSPGAMYIYDYDTYHFLAVNNAALVQYGYSEEEFLALSAEDIRPEEDIPQLYKARTDFSETYFDAGIFRHKRRNGEVFYVHIYAHFTMFEEQAAVAVLAVNVDKHMRSEQQNKLLNNAIREQKEQMDNILAALPEVIWSRNAETQEIIFINQACEQVYGYTPQELMASEGPIINNVHPDDIAHLQEAVVRTITDGRANCEYRIIHRDGSIRHLLDEAIYYHGEGDKPGTIMGIAIDITQQKKHLQQIETQNEQLREIGWLQSHQVRGPVATIMGLIDLFDKNTPANPDNTEILDKIQEAVRQLDNSIKAVVKKTYTKPS
jgi:PAS domain S-box-containing protein